MLRSTLVLFGCLFLVVGCVNAPYLGTDDLARVVENDASNLNRAHAHATNALILENILRARDRWPTHYTTLGGIQALPQTTLSAGLGLMPLGLGNPKNPLGGSSASLNQETVAKGVYSINPFSTPDDKAESVLAPTKKLILQYYWNNGWPKDVLAYLFISSIKIKNGNEEIWIHNHGEYPTSEFETAFNLITGDFVRMEKNKLEQPECPEIYRGPVDALLRDDRPENNHKTSVMTQIKALKEISGEKFHIDYIGEKGSKEFILQGCEEPDDNWIFVDERFASDTLKLDANNPLKDILDFRLRSFDDMIYYVGETLRKNNILVHGPCSREKLGVLFKVYDRNERDEANLNDFAAKTSHGGKTYFAAPRFDYSNKGLCNDHDNYNDRTSTVLSILTQLFLLNQSSQFLQAPENVLIER